MSPINPLSSFRLPVGPELTRGAGMSLTPDIAPHAIPQYELGKIGSLQPSTSIAPTGGSFEGALGRLVAEVANKDVAAKDAVAGLTSGVPLHQVMIANEEASIAFQLMVEVRNKLLESYQELMRMQV